MRNTLQTNEINTVNGGTQFFAAVNHCVSTGMSYAGLIYAIGAHRHQQLNQQALLQGNQVPAYAGTVPAVIAFIVGCGISILDDVTKL